MSKRRTGRPIEILIIEDSLVDAEVPIAALRNSIVRHRISLARDGEEAMSFLRREGIFRRAPRPDLILLDLRLPGRDGLLVLNEIKDDRELREIPLIIMTSSTDEQDRLECQRLRVDAYVTKPLDLEKFLQLVRKLRNSLQDDVQLPIRD